MRYVKLIESHALTMIWDEMLVARFTIRMVVTYLEQEYSQVPVHFGREISSRLDRGPRPQASPCHSSAPATDQELF
jgi:hypothetical protein